MISTFLDINKASEITGLSINTIYTYISRDRIPYHKGRNKRIYFLEKELRAWLDDKEISSDENNDMSFDIKKWMLKLKLSGNELLLYAALYSLLSRHKDSVFSGDIKELRRLTNLSNDDISSSLLNMEKKGLVRTYKDIFGNEGILLPMQNLVDVDYESDKDVSQEE